MNNKYFITQVDSVKVRGVLRCYAAANGWQPDEREDHMDVSADSPERDPWFFVDEYSKRYGFAQHGSVCREAGQVIILERMFDKIFAGPPKWEDIEVHLGCGSATIYKDGSITIRGATDIKRIKELVEIHEEHFPNR